MRLTRLFYFYVKSRYTKGFIIVSLISYLFIALLAWVRLTHPYIELGVVGEDIIFWGSLSIVIFGLIYPSYLTKSEMDFVLISTKVKLFNLILIKQLGDSLILLLIFLFFSILSSSSVLISVIGVILFSLFLSSLFIIGGVLNLQRRILINVLFLAYLLASFFVYPSINLIYLLINPSPFSLLYYVILLGLMEVFLYKISKELKERAISLTIYPSEFKNPIDFPFPSSFFGSILYTTFFSTTMRFGFYGSGTKNLRIPTLIIVIPPSVVGALILMLFKSSIVINNLLLIYCVTFYVTFIGQSFQNERLWIDFVGLNLMKYIRTRMFARLLLSYTVISPFGIVEIAHHLLGIGISLFALPLSSVPLTWLLISFRPPPQIRDIEQIPFKFSLMGVLIFIALAVTIWSPTLYVITTNNVVFSL
ncbi:hypothetical protein DJ521_06275, partial [Sulfolobus sp. E3]